MNSIKAIAIYLPQFHSIPENDLAWGKGFTEWTNVKKAAPLFEEHYQPHVPHDLVGYYNLIDNNVLIKQAELAKGHGVSGFAFYHYWFNGKRLLETPLDNMLKTGKPDFPFCYIWANENWTKRWDGLNSEVIQEQFYSPEDDLNHIRFLCKNVFSDNRYIRIDNKPVFLVYRTELLPDIKQTVKIWQDEAKRNGFEGLYLIRVESFIKGIIPAEILFDAALEFAPDWQCLGFNNHVSGESGSCMVIDYKSTILKILAKDYPEYIWFRCVFPGWDNTPRKRNGGIAFINNFPELFRFYVSRIAELTRNNTYIGDQFLFINAWNEWGEGCHLEPDLKNGTMFLEALKNGLDNSSYKSKSDYILFLEKSLNSIIDEKIEREQTIGKLQSDQDSLSFKIVYILLKPYRFLKRVLKKVRIY